LPARGSEHLCLAILANCPSPHGAGEVAKCWKGNGETAFARSGNISAKRGQASGMAAPASGMAGTGVSGIETFLATFCPDYADESSTFLESRHFFRSFVPIMKTNLTVSSNRDNIRDILSPLR